MAAPPPPHNHPIAVDDDDDGFDWEAAVREIDNACALASASAATATTSTVSMSAPGPNPSATAARFHRSSAGGARQSTLDRFVDSFTRRQLAKERAPPAPAVAAAAVAPTGGGGRPGVRADGGCSRKADREEVVEEPCAVALDHDAVQTWIYPTVVMYNYFRWFPEGKIVFTAPSRPLVTQQIEACHNTVGIPQKWTIDMKGNLSPSKRSSFWKSKRVFFVTPQILENDIQSVGGSSCAVKDFSFDCYTRIKASRYPRCYQQFMHFRVGSL